MIFILLKWDKYKILNCVYVCIIICCNIGIFLIVVIMCKLIIVIGNYVVIDVIEVGERMVEGINVCICYFIFVIIKEKVRFYVFK